MIARAAAFALGLLASAASAAEITGTARVIDGDTIVIEGIKIKLAGIDAPESAQTCTMGKSGEMIYLCGKQASLALQALTGSRQVTCTSTERDKYGRALATCGTSDTADIGDAMVRSGYAVDYAKYSHGRYLPAQSEAQGRGVGLWGGTFQMPEAWRKEHLTRTDPK